MAEDVSAENATRFGGEADDVAPLPASVFSLSDDPLAVVSAFWLLLLNRQLCPLASLATAFRYTPSHVLLFANPCCWLHSDNAAEGQVLDAVMLRSIVAVSPMLDTISAIGHSSGGALRTSAFVKAHNLVRLFF